MHNFNVFPTKNHFIKKIARYSEKLEKFLVFDKPRYGIERGQIFMIVHKTDYRFAAPSKLIRRENSKIVSNYPYCFDHSGALAPAGIFSEEGERGPPGEGL